MDALGLKRRVAFGNKIRELRNISPRTMNFIQHWKDKAQDMLGVSPFCRRKLTKEMDILDGEMQSRWDKLHGDEGIVEALLETFNAMAELRMKVEYGDYFKYSCSKLKQNDMDSMKWKVEHLDWQEVAEKILEEEKRREREEARKNYPLSPTPFSDDVVLAAEKLGCGPELIRYQIMQYAERNNFCHSGVDKMIEEGNFHDLAESIIEDKQALGVIFRGRPREQLDMRNTIVMIEKEWFSYLWVEKTSRGKRVQYVPTDKHSRKVARMAARVAQPAQD